MIKTSVSIGITSILGWLVGLGGALPLIVKLFEEGVAAYHVGGTEKWAAIFGLVIAAITQIGRYLQAHALVAHSTAAERKAK
jgi:hypothetical protein